MRPGVVPQPLVRQLAAELLELGGAFYRFSVSIPHGLPLTYLPVIAPLSVGDVEFTRLARRVSFTI
jgi:hypothetical protein